MHPDATARRFLGMDARKWTESITDDSAGTIAAKSGIARRTLYHQLDKGELTLENIVKIATAYDTSPIEALIQLHYIDRAWANVPDIVAALRLASDEQLTDEILRRLKLGSKKFDTPVDELMERRSKPRETPIRPVVDDDDPLAGIDPTQYAAHPRTENLDVDNFDA